MLVIKCGAGRWHAASPVEATFQTLLDNKSAGDKLAMHPVPCVSLGLDRVNRVKTAAQNIYRFSLCPRLGGGRRKEEDGTDETAH